MESSRRSNHYDNKYKMAVLCFISILVLTLTACGTGRDGQTGDLSSSGGTYKNDVPVSELRDAVADALGEDYWPNMALNQEEMESFFGISADSYEEAAAEIPMISTNVDTLVIVKAKEGSVDAVEEIINGYRDMLVNDTLQYPMNLGKIQASNVAVYGNYVCFFQLGGDTMTEEEQGEEAVIRKCQAANEKAANVIEEKLSGN